LKKKLTDIEEENTKLKESLARQDEELLNFSKLTSVVQYEASEASMVRDRAEAKLAKLFEEFKSLKAEHFKLQENHSILNEDLGQLEEKHSETLEQSNVSQALVAKAEEGKVVAEEKF
jgi:predicted  nucleic acid-binding Zn-ribbon protein